MTTLYRVLDCRTAESVGCPEERTAGGIVSKKERKRRERGGGTVQSTVSCMMTTLRNAMEKNEDTTQTSASLLGMQLCKHWSSLSPLEALWVSSKQPQVQKISLETKIQLQPHSKLVGSVVLPIDHGPRTPSNPAMHRTHDIYLCNNSGPKKLGISYSRTVCA